MKKLIVLFVLVVTSAYAQQIKINYFTRVNGNNIQDASAEVCGQLLGEDNVGKTLEVIPSYNTNIARRYYVTTGHHGIFCQVIAAFGGRVTVQTMDKNAVEPVRVQASLGYERE